MSRFSQSPAANVCMREERLFIQCRCTFATFVFCSFSLLQYLFAFNLMLIDFTSRCNERLISSVALSSFFSSIFVSLIYLPYLSCFCFIVSPCCTVFFRFSEREMFFPLLGVTHETYKPFSFTAVSAIAE